MMRTFVHRGALVCAAVIGLIGSAPRSASAQKALVYCPVTVDATGCTTIVNALTGPMYPLGVDRGYDGTNGTVDLETVDLFSYSVFVVPSLADGTSSQPYAKLRDPEVQEHLKAALIGRIAMWSGTPDQGATNRLMKDALIQNLAGWAAGAYATAKGPGLVGLLDASASVVARYDWVRAIAPLPVTSDANLLIYNSVRSLNQRGTSILTSGAGVIVYDNMATFGFQVLNGAAGVSLDVVGQTGTSQGGQVVLLTMEAGNASGATVKTDKPDYAPGETVTIAGAGWQAGETVKLTLHMDPLRDSDTELSAVADGTGKFVNNEFAPGAYDVGVRFVLSAIGQQSGYRAQTTFTDGNARLVHSNNVGDFTGSFKEYNGSANCSTAISTTGSGTVTNNAGGTGVSVPNNVNESVAFTVPATVGGLSFSGWTVSGTTFTGSLTNPVDFCVAGAGPNVNVTANYSAAVATTTTVSPASATYGDANVTLSATVSSTSSVNTGTVTFTVKQGATTIGSATTSGTVAAGAASVSYTLPAGTAAASYTIEAVYNAGTGFTGSNGTGTLTIEKKDITITPTSGQFKIFGEPDPVLTYTSSPVLPGGTITGTLARAAGENVGLYAIGIGTLTPGSNYTLSLDAGTVNFEIQPKPVTITPAGGQFKTYGDADPTLTYTSSPVLPAGTITGALSRVSGESVGLYAITLGTLTAGTNYSLALSGTVNFEIKPKPITITPNAGQFKIYGAGDPTLTFTPTPALEVGDSFSGALARTAGENAGLYPINLGTLSAGTNYTLTLAATVVSFEIKRKPLTITADDKTVLYGTAPVFSVSYGPFAFGELPSVLGGTLTYGGTAIGATNVGTYTIVPSGLTSTNYEITFVPGTLKIDPKPLTISVVSVTRDFGNVTPLLFGVSYSAFAYSETSTALGGSLVFTPAAATFTNTTPAGVTTINASGLTSTNYAISYVAGTMTILDTTAPVVSMTAVTPNPVPLNTPFTVTAKISDTATGGSNIVSACYTIDGGGCVPMTGTFGTQTVNVTGAIPARTSADVIEVCVYGTDSATPGNTNAKMDCVLVAIYDPSAGFVTGGGWIDSPKTAYVADPNLTGKANFGFVSKYKKGAAVPDGNTEFQFHAGNLNFKSSVYEWLVVAGARAQFKGTGTINGSGTYGFLLTAIDGQVSGGGGSDKFRIKIWDKNNGDAVVYDNQMGLSDTGDPTTLLGGGSINVQAK